MGEAEFLEPAEGVLGISLNGTNRAYPINILNYHEIVNDQFGEEAVVVTFCPLCGTGVVFRASFDGVEHTFGVSGLLYNSEVLMYDLSLLKNRIFPLRLQFTCIGDEGRRLSRVRQFDPDDRLTEPVCGQETPFNNLNI